MQVVDVSALKKLKTTTLIVGAVLALACYAITGVVVYKQTQHAHQWQQAFIKMGNGCESGGLIVVDNRIYHCYTVNPLTLTKSYP